MMMHKSPFPHRDPDLKKIKRSILLGVVFFHLICLICLICTPKQLPFVRHSIAVRTIDPLASSTVATSTQKSPQEPIPTTKTAPLKQASPSKKSPSKASTVAPKKKQKSKPKEKRIVAKAASSKPAIKKKEGKDKKNDQHAKLLQEVERSLAKIAPTPQHSSFKASAPSKSHPPLNIDLGQLEGASLTHGATHYREELAATLRSLLRLPEIGIVKVSLTLQRDGKVAHMTITSTQSELNRTYLLNTLPLLHFPPFGAEFPGEAQRTFPLTLSNDL